MTRWIGIVALGMMVFVLGCSVFPEFLELPGTLVFGWLNALRRIVAVLAASPATLAGTGVAVVAIVAGTQWLCAWGWNASRGSPPGQSDAPRWRWRWTLMLQAGLAATLFAAMSVIGLAHQTGWLIAAREPLFVDGLPHRRDLSNLKSLAGAIEATGTEHHWDTESIRSRVWQCFVDPTDWAESMQAVYLQNTNGRLDRALVFPRNPKTFARIGVGVVEPGAKLRIEPSSELTNLLHLTAPAARTAGLTP